MRKNYRLMLLVVVIVLSVTGLAYASAAVDNDGQQLKASLTQLNGSGLTGTGVVTIGEDGVTGRLKTEHLKQDHAYTVWFFYFEANAQGGPGRFASTVAEDDEFTFRGSVGGLRVSSGGTIVLVIFDHASLGPNNVTRAINLLTPTGGVPAAQAVFTIP
ncbi:MAG: hypothetical protein NVS9B15_12130 [Acidobacteriaceae bacterium]